MNLIERAAEASANLDELSRSEFGGAVHAEKIIVPTIDDDGLTVFRNHDILPQADIVPLGVNFSALTRQVGTGYGVLIIGNRERRLYPAVITSRTTVNALHLTYMPDPVVLPNGERNVNNDGDDMTLSPVQKALLGAARGIQDTSVGSEHSHGNVKRSVTELGHTAMALRALTDKDTMLGVKRGGHVVHDWSKGKAGIAAKITERDSHKPGMFDMKTSQGMRKISLPSMELQPGTPGIMLVRHKAFELPQEVNTKILIGLGLVSAQQYFRSEGDLRDTMLRTMESVD